MCPSGSESGECVFDDEESEFERAILEEAGSSTRAPSIPLLTHALPLHVQEMPGNVPR